MLIACIMACKIHHTDICLTAILRDSACVYYTTLSERGSSPGFLLVPSFIITPPHGHACCMYEHECGWIFMGARE